MPIIEDIGAEGDKAQPVKAIEEDDDEDIDETLTERLLGLTEMFPESVRNASSAAFSLTFLGLQAAYKLGRSGLWVAASSATILALPVMFETERAQMEEQQLSQQKQMLLGPGAAMAGGAGGAPGNSMVMPQVMPPSAASAS